MAMRCSASSSTIKIVAVLESRCEPWFEDAAVNTVVTILERCDNPAERDENPVCFVKVKRKLQELVPEDMRLQALARWQRWDALRRRIEAVAQGADDPLHPTTREDADLRIRAVRQGALRAQVEAMGQTTKWGSYLRAPDDYFTLQCQAARCLTSLQTSHPQGLAARPGLTSSFTWTRLPYRSGA